MTKKVFFPLFFLLISCKETAIETEIVEEITIDYPQSFIHWGDLFAQESDNYFVYVFSYDCYYCKQIKNKVICFHEVSKFPVYFCEYNKIIPLGRDIESTIGSNEIENVFIKGTPTLILISNETIAFNVAGKEAVIEMIDLYLKNE